MRAPALLLLASPCLGDTLVAWRAWKATHAKQYSLAEEDQRRACFARNVDDIARRNAEGHATFTTGPFADMCPEEFAAERLGKPRGVCTKSPLPPYHPPAADTAQSVDWRAKGAVTGVKDQGKCGSCWSFSATGNMEGQWFLKRGELLELSEQELVACDKGSGFAGDNGCKGGGPDTAIDWVIKNGGINTEGAYPYVSGTGKEPACDASKMATKAASFSSYTFIPDHNETLLLAGLQHEGPISIVVNANAWQNYKGGILDNDKQSGTDHAVLLVGYGHDGSQPYWLVKNSWGATWGESGYIRLAFGKQTSSLTTCVSTFATAACTNPDRYHCQDGKCVLACSGHSTMEKCTASCQ